MNRYLSTVGLYARLNLYKILLITLVTALLAGFLVYRYPMGELVLDANYDNPETGETTVLISHYPQVAQVIGSTCAPVVCAVGFTVIVAVMSLTGCGYGVKTDYTVRRLRVREKPACLLWAGYHAALLLFFWAVLALTLYGVMLLCYTDTFLHHLIPLQDAAVWGLCISSVLAVAFTTVLFSYRQRRGGFSLLVLLALAGTIGGFFCSLGENTNFLLMLLLLGVAGAALVMLMGGDGDAA